MANFVFQGKTLDVAEQTEYVQKLLQELKVTETNLQEKQNLLALLNRAKNSYVNDLKREVLSEKSGFNFLDE